MHHHFYTQILAITNIDHMVYVGPKFSIGFNWKNPILLSKRIVVDINFLCDMVQLKYKKQISVWT